MSLSEAAGALILLALGGLTGALLSGWMADYMTYRGMRAGRIVVAAGARLAGFPLFFLTFTLGNTPLMLVCFTFAAMCLIAPQAPLNAARADVLHPAVARARHLDGSRPAEQRQRDRADRRRDPLRHLRTADGVPHPAAVDADLGIDPAARGRHLRPRGACPAARDPS